MWKGILQKVLCYTLERKKWKGLIQGDLTNEIRWTLGGSRESMMCLCIKRIKYLHNTLHVKFRHRKGEAKSGAVSSGKDEIGRDNVHKEG